jgi:hypothetical protein
VFAELHHDRASALKREARLKGWTRAKKTALMASHPETDPVTEVIEEVECPAVSSIAYGDGREPVEGLLFATCLW